MAISFSLLISLVLFCCICAHYSLFKCLFISPFWLLNSIVISSSSVSSCSTSSPNTSCFIFNQFTILWHRFILSLFQLLSNHLCITSYVYLPFIWFLMRSKYSSYSLSISMCQVICSQHRIPQCINFLTFFLLFWEEQNFLLFILKILI